MTKLDERKIQGLRTQGRHGDGGGLHLYVRAGGGRTWVLRTGLRGKRTDFGLDAYPDVGLAEARERAREWRRLIRAGRGPTAVAVAAAFTLEAAAREFHATHAAGWAPGHAARWIGSLERYAFPNLGARPMASIKPTDVAEVLLPIWAEKHDTAKRLRQRIMGVFDWAHAAGRLEGSNPMLGLPRLVPRIKREVRHFRSAPWAELPPIYAALREHDAMAARVLAFLVLTVPRSQEARGARWAEIGWTADEGHVWTIPAARMKGATSAHRIPLAPPAVAILEELRGDDDELVFPTPARRGAAPMSGQAFDRLWRRMGVHHVTTTHGLRATFRTWCGDTGHDRTLAEVSLAHAHGNRVEQAYMRSDLLRRRREMMEAWARHVTGHARAHAAEQDGPPGG